MMRVILDAQMRSKLLDLTEPLDLCDETGRALGTFRPLATRPPNGYVEEPLSEEEWRQREQGPGYTTEEVIAFLEKL